MLAALHDLDISLLHLLNGHHAGWLDILAVGLAWGGRLLVWLVPALWVAARRPGRWAGVWQLVVALLLTWAVTDAVLKPLLWRDRPYAVAPGVHLVGSTLDSSSFPSGHASSAFAGAFALSRLWPAAGPAGWLLASLVAVGRVYQGVHYPSDVLAGALVGWACAYFAAGTRACYSEQPAERATSVPR